MHLIRRLIEMCEQRSIQFVIVANPLPESVATPENLAGLDALEAQLRDLAQSEPHVTLFAPSTKLRGTEPMADAAPRSAYEVMLMANSFTLTF